MIFIVSLLLLTIWSEGKLMIDTKENILTVQCVKEIKAEVIYLYHDTGIEKTLYDATKAAFFSKIKLILMKF